MRIKQPKEQWRKHNCNSTVETGVGRNGGYNTASSQGFSLLLFTAEARPLAAWLGSAYAQFKHHSEFFATLCLHAVFGEMLAKTIYCISSSGVESFLFRMHFAFYRCTLALLCIK